MNWSKAKNVIILVFVILNIFLLVNLIILKADRGISPETLRNTKTALKERGITVNLDEIPGYTVDNVMLNYEVYDGGRNAVIKAFLKSSDVPDSIERGKVYNLNKGKIEIADNGGVIISMPERIFSEQILNEKGIKDYLTKLLKDTQMPIKDYVIESFKILDTGDINIKLIQKYKGYYIFDNYLNINVYGDGKSRIEFDYKKVISLKKDRSTGIKVKPVYQILLNNYTKGMTNSIDAVDVGFKCSNIDNNSKLIQQRPVWRVKLGDGSTDYYNVYTGEKVK